MEDGQLQGRLLQELRQGVHALEQELEVTSRILNRRAQLKHLAAAEDGGGVVLQTYTVSLQDVRAELSKWVDPLKSEYVSLTQTTGAVKPTTMAALQGENNLEFAPAGCYGEEP